MTLFEDAVGIFWEMDRREKGVLRRVIIWVVAILGFGIGRLWLLWRL